MTAEAVGALDGEPVESGPAMADRLNAELVRHARLSHMLKTALAAWTPANVDWGAMQVLLHLVKDGPRRQGELAECILLDASTVSRRVGQLVALGYVERRPDPIDGRAVQLAATQTGEAVFEQFRARREEAMQQIFASWPPEEMSEFLRLLRRLNDDLEVYRPLLARTTAADPVPPFPGR
jgi:DNA-binding MarR family transcriptional regulator